MAAWFFSVFGLLFYDCVSILDFISHGKW